MSLNIHQDNITSVLLPDGWHEVAHDYEGKSTFVVDAYEFVYGDDILDYDKGTGFEFRRTDGAIIAGPMQSLLAVARSR